MNVCSLLLGLFLLCGVSLDAVEELLSALRVVDMFNADVDAFLNVAISNSLVDDDAQCGFGDIIDNPGLPVVNLVRHTVAGVSATTKA